MLTVGICSCCYILGARIQDLKDLPLTSMLTDFNESRKIGPTDDLAVAIKIFSEEAERLMMLIDGGSNPEVLGSFHSLGEKIAIVKTEIEKINDLKLQINYKEIVGIINGALHDLMHHTSSNQDK